PTGRTISPGGCPWEERPRFGPGASPETIQACQQAVGSRLPDDLVDFLRRCDTIAAMGVWNGYWIGAAADLADPGYRDDFPAAVNGRTGPEPVVPVARDGGGNAFLQSLVGGQVWRWDHETGAVRVVAPSFHGFLERVAEDWEHAAEDNGDWSYLV